MLSRVRVEVDRKCAAIPDGHIYFAQFIQRHHPSDTRYPRYDLLRMINPLISDTAYVDYAFIFIIEICTQRLNSLLTRHYRNDMLSISEACTIFSEPARVIDAFIAFLK
ncbi:hypothetical protein CUJ89_02185 [Burkholderia pyrrocinia]|uniref:Uncharacterized protein n=1 Tax=Burkholderia pyrrocinia TaxID=60550 RepID=A0A2Z5MSJ8_BURPY|nr:hypothetical protein CUJ89_02185 [Burkholderia pyrrocinia]